MHLTVSPDHLDGFQTEAARILPKIEKETGLILISPFPFRNLKPIPLLWILTMSPSEMRMVHCYSDLADMVP